MGSTSSLSSILIKIWGVKINKQNFDKLFLLMLFQLGRDLHFILLRGSKRFRNTVKKTISCGFLNFCMTVYRRECGGSERRERRVKCGII